MIRHDESFDELSQLMGALFDASITPEEAARLEQLVEASEGARQQFLDCADPRRVVLEVHEGSRNGRRRGPSGVPT